MPALSTVLAHFHLTIPAYALSSRCYSIEPNVFRLDSLLAVFLRAIKGILSQEFLSLSIELLLEFIIKVALNKV
jgi:hypothetical protein